MALTKSASVQELTAELITIYNTAFEGYTAASDEICMKLPTDSKKVVHGFVPYIAGFREWKDERLVKSIAVEEIVVNCLPYEQTHGVSKDSLRNPREFELVKMGLVQAAEKAKMLQDKLVAAWLEGATGSEAKYANWDGDPTFSTTHTRLDGTNQANRITSQALDETNLKESLNTFAALTNALGDPLQYKATHLVVPSALEITARGLVEIPYKSGGATNEIFNIVKVVVLPTLTSSTSWYLMAVKSGLKPMVNHVFQDVEQTDLTKADDANMFWSRMGIFGADAVMGMASAPWEMLQKNES